MGIEKFFLTTLNIFNRIYFNSYYPCLLNLKMGSQQSTRRLTVVNDEAAGVIKISDSVVERIQSELEQGKAAAAKKEADRQPQVSPPTPAPPVETSPPPAEVEVPSPPSPPPPVAPVTPPTTVQPKPVIQYVEKEPSLSSLRIKAEKEKEL